MYISLLLTYAGLSESFEVDGWVVKVSSQSRDIFLKNAIHKEIQAEKPVDTNQVGGDFRQQPATFDNPIMIL